MTTQLARPTRKEMLLAAACLALALGGAFLAASLIQDRDFFKLVPAPPNDTAPNIFRETQQLDLRRTFFTAWATLILVTPALCTFLFRRSSESAARYWQAFWTVSFVAFLVHFYWGVSVMFDNDWNRIAAADHRVSAPVLDTVVAAWWGRDVLASWLVRSEGLWAGVERTILHVAVFALFFLGSAREGERKEAMILGVAMGVAVLGSFLIWLIRRLKKSKRVEATASA